MRIRKRRRRNSSFKRVGRKCSVRLGINVKKEKKYEQKVKKNG